MEFKASLCDIKHALQMQKIYTTKGPSFITPNAQWCFHEGRCTIWVANRYSIANYNFAVPTAFDLQLVLPSFTLPITNAATGLLTVAATGLTLQIPEQTITVQASKDLFPDVFSVLQTATLPEQTVITFDRKLLLAAIKSLQVPASKESRDRLTIRIAPDGRTIIKTDAETRLILPVVTSRA